MKAKIDTTERRFIELTKRAKRISIVVDCERDCAFRLDFPKGNPASADIHKLSHDIAIAIQDYYTRMEL